MAFLDDEKNENIQESEAVSNETVSEEVVVEEPEVQTQTEKNEAKVDKTNESKKPSKIKALFSELKKVTWPGFGSVVKKTLVVLSVTAVFLVVVFGIDSLLKLLYDLLTKNM